MKKQFTEILKVVGVILLGGFILGGVITFGARYIRFDQGTSMFKIGDDTKIGGELYVDGNVNIATTTPHPNPPNGVTNGNLDVNDTWIRASNAWVSQMIIPAGTVMFFNLAACPAGWTELVAARGRYIVGRPNGGTLGGTVGQALGNLENRTVGKHTHEVLDPGHQHLYPYVNLEYVARKDGGSHSIKRNYYHNEWTNASTTGISILHQGAVDGTNAPYIQLLTCQKQ